ncbi:TMEM175 family protein [Rhabdothermincola salaria]|uniref:TMEM175 family protein n=1 Tax=Rhabdothermincola salaria TaxID=2903142 RepID=UPI001E299A4F|nr:TMEM175 family protein [Rhabdothermincola salaria]MCD9623517.1 DUF1211 domain-containing protein [Rhabdothermincola salaria]
MGDERETGAELQAGLRQGRWTRDSLEFARLLNLSDGVFGFALTLLVTGITVPTLASGQSLSDGLGDQVPAIIAFTITVVLIGRFWMAHHSQWSTYGSIVPPVMFANVVYLGSVAFLPFPMAVLGRYDGQTAAVVLQAVALAVVSTMEVVVDVVADANDCLRIERNRAQRRRLVVAGLVPTAVFLASIPVAFVSGTLAMWTWLLIIPVELALDKVLDPERTATPT